MTGRRPDVPERRPAAVPGMLLLAHFAIALLFVLDFILFQAAATATTVAIYSIIPMLDDSIVRAARPGPGSGYSRSSARPSRCREGS